MKMTVLVMIASLHREFFNPVNEDSYKSGTRVLLLQCDSGNENADLIACTRYNIWDEYSHVKESTVSKLAHVVLLIQLPRVAGGCFVGFQVKYLLIIDILPSKLSKLI